MGGENQKTQETKRLTIWAVIFIVMGIMSVLLLEIDQASEMLDFLTQIIINLIVGS